MSDRIRINRKDDYAAIYVDGEQFGTARLDYGRWSACWVVRRGSGDRLPPPFATDAEAIRSVLDAAQRAYPDLPPVAI